MVGLRMKSTTALRAKAEGLSHSRTDIAIRDLNITIDEPIERGGTNLGPTPTDAALAALIACTNVIGHKCADSLGIDIGHMSVDAKCDFDRRGVTLEQEIDVPFRAIQMAVLCDGDASETELIRLGEKVAKYCPLSKLFENAGTKLEITWQKA